PRGSKRFHPRTGVVLRQRGVRTTSVIVRVHGTAPDTWRAPMTAIGFITIGQAPRKDITPDIIKRFPDEVRVKEAGALDRFDSASEVEATVGRVEGEPVFVTRLRDNTSVIVHRDSVIELLQERMDDIKDDVEMMGSLCTGYFPVF